MSDGLADMMCCAFCGKAEVDDVKLKGCACKLVKYCSVDCREKHRDQHDEECKKRKTDLHGKKYLRSPISVIWESARFVACHCRLIDGNLP